MGKNASNSNDFFILACVFVPLSTDWQMLLNKRYQQCVGNIWSSMESQEVRKSVLSNLADHSFLRPVFPSRIWNINALVSIKICQRQLQLVVLVDDCSRIHGAVIKRVLVGTVCPNFIDSSLNLYHETERLLLTFILFHRVTTDLKLSRRKSLF